MFEIGVRDGMEKVASRAEAGNLKRILDYGKKGSKSREAYMRLQGTSAMGRITDAKRYAEARMKSKKLGKQIAKMKAMTKGTTPMPNIKSTMDKAMEAAKGAKEQAGRRLRKAQSTPLRGDITRKKKPSEYVPRIYLHGSQEPKGSIEDVFKKRNAEKALNKDISSILKKKAPSKESGSKPTLKLVGK